mgnify:FL=1
MWAERGSDGWRERAGLQREKGGGRRKEREEEARELDLWFSISFLQDSPVLVFTSLIFFFDASSFPPFAFSPQKHQNGSGRHRRRAQQGSRRHQGREGRQARREEGGK